MQLADAGSKGSTTPDQKLKWALVGDGHARKIDDFARGTLFYQSFLLLSLFAPHVDSTGVRLRDC